jgi:hypothetical protein
MVLADALVVVAGLPRGSDAVPPRHPAGHRRGLARIDATCPAPWTTPYLKLIADQPAIVSRARALPIIENAWMFITSIPRTAKPRSTSRDAIRAGASTGAGVTSPNRAIDSPSRFRGADDDQISAMRRLSLQGFQLFWRWKSRQRGRPRLPADLRRSGPRLARTGGDCVSSRAPPYCTKDPRAGRWPREDSPQRELARATVCVTIVAAATPRTTLTNGLTGTIDGSVRVPGWPRNKTRNSSRTLRRVQFLMPWVTIGSRAIAPSLAFPTTNAAQND